MQRGPDGKPDTRWGKSRTPIPAERSLDDKISERKDAWIASTHRPLTWSPASSGCGLHGKLLGKPQGCKQEEPNVFQPPLHMFSKHCFSDQLKSCVVTPAYWTYSVNMRPETGTVQPRCVQWFEGRWSVFLPTRLPSRPKCACTASSLDQRPSHLTNIFEAFPMWIPLMKTSATVSSPSQSSSILDASSCEVESWNWPV